MSDTPETDWQLLLSEAERTRMLQDIAQVALTVGRHLFTDAQRDDLDITVRSILTRKSPVERLGFIARTLPPLTQAIEQIACIPLAAPLTVKRAISPPERARRLTGQDLIRSAQRGLAARRLVETVTALSPDTPQNRAVLSYLNCLRRDTTAIADMAEAAGETEIAQTARHCTARLRGLRERLGWEGIVRHESGAWSAPPTHRMPAHPAYAQLAQWMRRYRQDFGFDWDTPLFRLPARETWRLYEAWGLFQTLGALLALGYAPVSGGAGGTTAALFAVKNDRLLFRLVKGEESAVTLRSPRGYSLRLFYSRTSPARQRSLSRTMQPDISLVNEAGDTWILDPKFKSYGAAGDEGGDMDQMHAYRDAIIDGEGRKPVQRAWCLYAGSASGGSRPMVAYGTPEASIVGALRLRPADPDGFLHLCDLLASWDIA